jgi:drug/metabolite transporter (DMT)-like permease
MVASIPLWVVLIDAIRPRGPKPDWKIMLGVLLGFGGIALLVTSSGGTSPADQSDLPALLVLLLAALIWSYGSIYGRDADMPESSLLGTGIEMLGGAAGLILVGTLLGEWGHLRPAEISINSALGVLYLILFGSLVGFVSYSWLLRNAPLSLVSTYAYVNPVVAVFLGAWIGREVITGAIVVAASIIVGSVAVITLSKQTRVERRKEPAVGPAD